MGLSDCSCPLEKPVHPPAYQAVVAGATHGPAAAVHYFCWRVPWERPPWVF
jgi:hypothetical protein